MKTKSITYALKGIALLAFYAAVPAAAQLNFELQKSNFFSGQEKLLATSSLNYHALNEPYHPDPDIGFISVPYSFPIPDNGIREETVFADKLDVAPILPFVGNVSRYYAGDMKIRFKPSSFYYRMGTGKDLGVAEYSNEQLMLYAIIAKEYAKKNGYDTTYAFLSNMGMLNNKKRFFVVNLITMRVEQSGFVAQGRGQGVSRFDKQYSNKKESKCTSLGKYKIMKKYYGEYGSAYRMMGLDPSNNNAFSRNIVLHSMGCMPDTEGSMPVCISEGCPAVSVKFLSALGKIIDSRKKPVLLWIFDSNLEEAVMEPMNTSEDPVEKEEENSYHRCPIHRPRPITQPLKLTRHK